MNILNIFLLPVDCPQAIFQSIPSFYQTLKWLKKQYESLVFFPLSQTPSEALSAHFLFE